jgi:hypothetical protein
VSIPRQDLSSKSRSAESLRAIAREGMDLSAFKTLVKKKALPFDDEMVSVSQQYRLPERTMRYTRWRSNPVFRSQVEQLFEAADEDSSGSIDDKEVDKLVKQMNILAAGAFLVAALTLPVSRINSCNQLCHEHFSPWPFAAGIFKSMKKSQGESVFEVAKPAATTATPLPSPREGTKSVTIKVDQL